MRTAAAEAKSPPAEPGSAGTGSGLVRSQRCRQIAARFASHFQDSTMADATTREPARPEPIRLADYRPPDWLIDRVELDFRLAEGGTEVGARLSLRRNPAAGDGARPLVLDGQELELLGLAVDGEALGANRYSVGEDQLTIEGLPAACTLESRVRIHPEANTALEGLYVSNGNFCTQCEPEGFRKITYFLDRPDVMARYRVRIEAERERWPVLLANGNRVAEGALDGGRHFAVWEDPFPKPTYLFALVAGRLAKLADSFTTRSGRKVALEIYTEPHEIDKCDHAMASLKRSMQWDEDRFGLEYDLDVFMIVAVSDFNFGAMENKGLNIFNTKYVLARPETATDTDYLQIEAVIAHEYFHNWTGDRVTCRDWFQLSLKEGLTVFRDQEFTSDLHSRAVKRIADVRRLRATQFLEDAGPLAHPVRPESYVEINNFYTTTVYEKGAEVIRMLHTLIGENAFQQGMQLYFERHDGQAVTCEDFVAAMEAASGRDLTHFRRWYSQAGTPRLTVEGAYDPQEQSYTLSITQATPPTPGQPDKRPLHIPLAMALLDPAGREVPLRLEGEPAAAGTSRVLELRQAQERFTFTGLDAPPTPSLLRGFSAPVVLESDADAARLRFLMAHDGDPFVRWESGQSYALQLMLRLVEQRRAGRALTLDEGLAEAFAATLADQSLEPAFVAQALSLPSEGYVGQQMAEIDVDGVHAVREFLRAALGKRLATPLRKTYHALERREAYSFEAAQAGRRALRNLALAYLMAAGDDAAETACLAQYAAADNMTDTIAALGLLAESELPERQDALQSFYQRWQADALVVDKWFSLQAMAQRPDAVAVVTGLLDHEAFTLKNPNRVRALLGAFALGNPTGFHQPDGAGYALIADHVLALDQRNPQVASRLAQSFGRWRRYDAGRQRLMRGQLERILAAPKLSRDVYEIASKSLQ
jgi:aminopeptidase N